MSRMNRFVQCMRYILINYLVEHIGSELIGDFYKQKLHSYPLMYANLVEIILSK